MSADEKTAPSADLFPLLCRQGRQGGGDTAASSAGNSTGLRSTPGPCAAAKNIGARIQAVGNPNAFIARRRPSRGRHVPCVKQQWLADRRGPRTGSIG